MTQGAEGLLEDRRGKGVPEECLKIPLKWGFFSLNRQCLCRSTTTQTLAHNFDRLRCRDVVLHCDNGQRGDNWLLFQVP
ncbi:hypothetical protein QFZ80_005870 [Paenibacillus sp. V4I7]|nr:hypothetical protein [Paenibacillus sp. V4I7]MDQ0919463.1 hypothetical protein [Paenibacillus sp. V4I5]